MVDGALRQHSVVTIFTLRVVTLGKYARAVRMVGTHPQQTCSTKKSKKKSELLPISVQINCSETMSYCFWFFLISSLSAQHAFIYIIIHLQKCEIIKLDSMIYHLICTHLLASLVASSPWRY